MMDQFPTPKAPRRLTEGDRQAARSYAARHLSDPFAYARACSRLSHGLTSLDDLGNGMVAIP